MVANAGIDGSQSTFEQPKDLDAAEPPPPSLKVIDVNLTGVLYTTHLALYYLARNPNSVPASPSTDLVATHRDRHLLLVGSLASLSPLTSQALYGAAKHGVLGLFRSLRSSSFAHGYASISSVRTLPTRIYLAQMREQYLQEVVWARSRMS